MVTCNKLTVALNMVKKDSGEIFLPFFILQLISNRTFRIPQDNLQKEKLIAVEILFGISFLLREMLFVSYPYHISVIIIYFENDECHCLVLR